MSKIALTPNGSGSGVFTIASPNSNTNRTITLPDESVTLGAGTPSIDDNGNATALTIDSSENVLIGNTDATPYTRTSGNAIALGDGLISSAQSGGNAAIFNRMTSDGSIVGFRKGGAAVGNIGVVSDDRMYFATADGLGLQFDKDNNRIIPCDATGGYNSNVELGDEGLAFTNLFLTGGIQFDSRSSKLEDYEEGTFTAGVETGTVGGGDGVYVKVGDMVYVGFSIGNFSNTSSGNAIVFNGLPFASNSNNHGCNGSVFCRYISGGFPDASQINTSATTGRMWKSGSTAWASVNHNDITSGTNCYFFVCLTYRAA